MEHLLKIYEEIYKIESKFMHVEMFEVSFCLWRLISHL